MGSVMKKRSSGLSPAGRHGAVALPLGNGGSKL